MNAYKMLRYNVKEGIFRCKRYWILIVVTLLQCMLAEIQMGYRIDPTANLEYGFFELFLLVFEGAAPYARTGIPTIPYGWLALFAAALFPAFDYMYHDLMQFGVQILTRTERKISWWVSKCLWCLLSALAAYLLILASVLVFCFVERIPLTLQTNPAVLRAFTVTPYYQSNGLTALSIRQTISVILCPLLALMALQLMQMTLSLWCKPLYSFLLTIGLCMLSMAADFTWLFSRMGMVLYHDCFFLDGYSMQMGTVACIAVILLCVAGGGIFFQFYDILPDKEAV